MIVEGLVTTLNNDGTPHLAPMGPRIETDFSRFTLRPFPTSHTYENLLRDRAGVFHITDDALLLARAALGAVKPFPEFQPATQVRGIVLGDSCRHYEFLVRSVQDTGERLSLEVECVCSGRTRDFLGFNRAKHAIVEAAILATRLHLLPLAEVERDFRKLRLIVQKTGGRAEHEAMDLLEERLRCVEAAR